MITGVHVVGLDGDDTLWHSEGRYHQAQQRFTEIVARHGQVADLDRRLLAVEQRNLGLFGYGVKGFTLSMIETAIEVTGGRISAAEVKELIELGRGMLAEPVVLVDGAAEAVGRLAAAGFRLLLLTKGDLFDQEYRIAQSGLAPHFWQVEVVSEKDPATYRRILGRLGVAPAEFLMCGNSMRSDVLPVLEVGAAAVHVPYHLTWSHEVAGPPPPGARFAEIAALSDLPALLTPSPNPTST